MAVVAAYASFTIVRRVQPIVVAASAGVAAMLVDSPCIRRRCHRGGTWPSASRQPPWCFAGSIRGIRRSSGSGPPDRPQFPGEIDRRLHRRRFALYLIILASSGFPRRKVYVAIGCVVPIAFGLLLAGAPSLKAFIGLLAPLVVVAFVGFGATANPGISQDQPVPLPLVGHVLGLLLGAGHSLCDAVRRLRQRSEPHSSRVG